MNWPWQRRRKPKKESARPGGALRQLFRNYQKQAQMWGLVIVSAVVVACLFFLSMVVMEVSLYTFIIPALVVAFAGFQLKKCRSMVAILRHALMIQQEIDKADAIKREEAVAAAGLEAARAEADKKRIAEDTKAAASRAAFDRGLGERPAADA